MTVAGQAPETAHLGDGTAVSAAPAPETALIPAARPLTEPADGTPPVVDTLAALEQACAALAAGTGPVAVDAERAGGYRYGHGAYLVQIRREGSGTHLIDPLPFDDLTSVSAAISGSEWILHAASQDIPCLTEIGMIPERLFDTEIAARLLGRPKVGLAALTESELGYSLAKEHSAADWSTRPLPESWLRYAALDVELLVQLRDILANDLADSGRLDWAVEEFEYVRTNPAKPARKEPWRRVSGIHRVRSPRQLAVVRELWLQRDELARTRDIAPGRVLPDAAIAAAAMAKPATKAAFAELPQFQGRGAKRRLDLWWSAVERAMAMPADELPGSAGPSDGPPPPRSWPDRAPAAAARLTAARASVLAVSEELGIPAENLMTPESVRRLCWTPPENADLDAVREFLTGLGARNWQVTLLGDDLVAALAAVPEPAPVTAVTGDAAAAAAADGQ